MTEDTKVIKLAKADHQEASSALYVNGATSENNPWGPENVDKLELFDEDDYRKTVESCRFFYKKDPIASSVINKLVDIGISSLRWIKNGTPDNEMRVYKAMEENLCEFAQNMALEYLISGLVVPEVTFAPVQKNVLTEYGIKKYSTLTLPVDMWLRDPATIIINSSLLGSKPSYFVEVPEDLVYFIQHKGSYPDGTKDENLYTMLVTYYGDFVQRVNTGERKILLKNDYIIRRRVLSNTAYPMPYLTPTIDDMRHKRNLRRMDYAVASRVITAILLVKLGSDLFPLTEEDGPDQLASIKQQMLWRDTTGANMERIFQLFGNHTLQLEWVVPPTDTLLNEAKYIEVNENIIIALGFPRILMTGESERSNTSDPQYATVSPIETMKVFRNKITTVLQSIVNRISKENSFNTVPSVLFRPLQLANLQLFVDGLVQLYSTGNLSRQSFDEVFGYDYKDESVIRQKEEKDLADSGTPEFAPQPYSAQPQNTQNQQGNQNQKGQQNPKNQDGNSQ